MTDPALSADGLALKPTHAELVTVAEKWLRRQGCGVVLTEHHGGTLEIPDAIGWRKWHSIQVECKVSLEDFRRDMKKGGRRVGHAQATECFYLAPVDLIDASILPMRWGLLEWNGRRVTKRAPAARIESVESLRAGVTRLFCELRRYQVQGIRYLTIAEQDAQKVKNAEARSCTN